MAERERILAMLNSADINCRRDSLWDQLMMWDMEDMDAVATTSTKKGKKRDSAEEDDSQVRRTDRQTIQSVVFLLVEITAKNFSDEM